MKVSHSLAEIGHEVNLWVPGEISVGWNELTGFYGLRTEFQVHWLRSIKLLRRYDFTWLSVNQAISWGADLVYTWLPQVGTFSLRKGMPAILELHDRPTGQFGPYFVRRFTRMQGVKRLLVITQALQQAVEKSLDIKVKDEEIQIAPNGVELERYADLPDPVTARQQLGLPQKTTAVYTGHFYKGRGIELLIGLAQRFFDIQFLWVGGTTASLAELQIRLDSEKIKNVTMTGFIDNRNLPMYQAAGEILLMPYERSIAGSSGGNSADICSPMKMFEYLACGRAILTSDLPVLHEVLNKGNAYFCEPENPETWSSGLQHLLNDPAFCRKLGSQALADANKYTWRERASRALTGLIPEK
jgi:glycosyltransferase involved in cell wall biosynthesis